MAIKNLGNFKKTLGIYEMSLGEDAPVLEFENGYSGEDLVEFLELVSSKKGTPDLIKYIISHLNKNNMFEDWKDQDISRFVVENLKGLMKGYFVMYNLTSEEAFEDTMKEATEKLRQEQRGEEDSKSPIETK